VVRNGALVKRKYLNGNMPRLTNPRKTINPRKIINPRKTNSYPVYYYYIKAFKYNNNNKHIMSDNISYKIIDAENNQVKFENISQSKVNAPVFSSTSFDENVKSYIIKNKQKLVILTPCFGGINYVNFTICLINTMNLFQRINFPIKVEFCKNDSLVSRARNNLIAKGMSDIETTHFMFIDNDITWDPIDILKLVIADKQLCGGVYPLKNYNWNSLIVDEKNPTNSNIIQSFIDRKNNSQLKSSISDEQMVKYNLLKYNINFLDSVLQIESNMAKVRHLATGFMLIQRNVIEKMFKAFPSMKYTDDVGFLSGTEIDYAYALFDCGVEEGHYFSEDWLFCHRWSKMGGDIFVDVSINLTHTGIEDYKGSFIASVI
jgi:hypothetical protein